MAAGHFGAHPLREQENALQVHGEHLVPFLFAQLKEGLVADQPGYVHQDVDPAKARHGVAGQPVHIGAARHVGHERFGAPARAANFLGRPGDAFAADIGDGHIGPRPCQRQRHTFADAARGPCDQGDLIFEQHKDPFL